MIQDESKKLFSFITKVIAMALVISIAPTSAWAEVQGSISRVGDATHIEFRGLSKWNYELNKKDGNKVVLQVPKFDQKTEVELRTWTGQFIDGVDIDKAGVDGKYTITFQLSDSDVENFDYLTDEPSRLIIDFFRQVQQIQPEVAKPNVETQRSNKSKKPSKRIAKSSKTKGDYNKYERLKKSGERKPAGELDPKYDIYNVAKNKVRAEYPQEGVFDGGDPNFNRFRLKDYEIKEESIIASRQNFYIRFPMLKMKTSMLDLFMATKPQFVITEKDTRENKEARLLLQLHKKGRVGLFMKTYRYFTEKYPSSEYEEIIKHLAAEIHLDRYLKDDDEVAYKQAKNLYLELLKKYSNSPLAERIELVLGYAELERMNGIETLQRFQAFLDRYNKSDHRDQARKSIAAAYLILNKYDDALRTYLELTKNPDSKKQGIEASYRLGDVHFQNREYKRAIETYENALKLYPKHESEYPNAHYNMASLRREFVWEQH